MILVRFLIAIVCIASVYSVIVYFLTGNRGDYIEYLKHFLKVLLQIICCILAALLIVAIGVFVAKWVITGDFNLLK